MGSDLVERLKALDIDQQDDWQGNDAQPYKWCDEADAAIAEAAARIAELEAALSAATAAREAAEAAIDALSELSPDASKGSIARAALAAASPFMGEAPVPQEAPAEPVATGVEFYKAVNARNNHSGRGLAFDGGCLNLKKDGSGEFVFDRDAEIVSEEGKDLLIARIPASEIEFLRDYLAEAFPAARPVPAAEPAPPARQDALREALASHIATALDDIDVDTRGRCKWSEVATARDKIYRAVRSAALTAVPATEAREGK